MPQARKEELGTSFLQTSPHKLQHGMARQAHAEMMAIKEESCLETLLMRVEELKPGANLFVTSVGGVENLHAKHKQTARASNQVPTAGIIAADSVHQQFLLEDIRTTHLLVPPAKN